MVTAGATALLAAVWGKLAYATFDDELARADGVRTGALELVLYLVAAVVIAVSSVVVTAENTVTVYVAEGVYTMLNSGGGA